jgi:hypothetical protein
VLSPVVALITKNYDTTECIEALWLLSFLTVNSDESVCSRLSDVPGLCLKVLSESSNPNILVPALRILDNTLPHTQLCRTTPLSQLLLAKLPLWEVYVQREALLLVSNALAEYADYFLGTDGCAWVSLLLQAVNDQELTAEVCIAVFNIAAAADGKYRALLQTDRAALFLAACLNTVSNAPYWIKLGIHTPNDEDSLLASLVLLRLAKVEEWGGEGAVLLESQQLQEAAENCVVVLDHSRVLKKAAEELLQEFKFEFS